MKIPLFDVAAVNKQFEKEYRKIFKTIFISGGFILGEQLVRFEKEFASYVGVRYAVGVASGTDAITLALKATGVEQGDEVIVPANSYPTAFAVAAAAKALRLVDIAPQTFTIDPSRIEKAITSKTKAIVPVHLYGQPADMDRIMAIAKKHRLAVVEDVAQAHGALFKNRKVGGIGDVGCFSFYPTKNLGGIGDGGMVVTNNERLANIVRELRMYGEATRYQSLRIGKNSRLDEIQAAFLRIKLRSLDSQNRLRQTIAKEYKRYLNNTSVVLPEEKPYSSHVYHLFVIRTKKRNQLKQFLLGKEKETGIHFPLPIHLVKAFSYLPYKKGDFKEAEQAAKEILSLPCYPGLSEKQVSVICALVKSFYR